MIKFIQKNIYNPVMKKQKFSGFSLIELLIVIIIISILISFSIPNYQKYIIKAKLLEVLSISADIKNNIIEYYIINDNLPKSNEEAGIEYNKNNNIIENINIQNNGKILIKLKNKNIATEIRAKEIIFTPDMNSDGINWICKTNINPIYLPFKC